MPLPRGWARVARAPPAAAPPRPASLQLDQVLPERRVGDGIVDAVQRRRRGGGAVGLAPPVRDRGPHHVPVSALEGADPLDVPGPGAGPVHVEPPGPQEHEGVRQPVVVERAAVAAPGGQPEVPRAAVRVLEHQRAPDVGGVPGRREQPLHLHAMARPWPSVALWCWGGGIARGTGGMGLREGGGVL